MKDTEEAVAVSVEPFVFSGLKSATAISDKRVTLKWDAAAGGVSNPVYTIYKDRNFAIPLATTSETSYLVSGLAAGSEYNFTVRASDTENEEFNNVVKFVTTYTEPRPDFNGLKSLSPAPGLEGENKLIATWDAAIPPAGKSIGYYNVYVSTEGEKQNFSTPTYQTTGTSFVIGGLDSGTRYYVVVRAEDDSGMEEKNSVERVSSTNTSSPIIFTGLNSAAPGAGLTAFNTINLSWSMAFGSFDEYRVYASTTSGGQDFVTATKIVGFIFTSTQLTNIEGTTPNTTYFIVVRACNSILNICDNNTVQRIVTTAPPRPSFIGITSANLPSGLDGMTRANLAWNTSATGVFNKYKVFVRYPSGPGNTSYNFALNGGGTDYQHAIMEASSVSSSIQITGLTQDIPVCFAIRAVYADGTNFLQDLQSPIAERCVTPTLAPPAFAGITSATGGHANYASTLSWSPASGVFDSYRVFIGTSSANAVALANDPLQPCPAGISGCRVIVPSNQTSHVFSPVAANTTYHYLVRARYSGTGQTDGNSVTRSDTGGPAMATHGGWVNILSTGVAKYAIGGNKEVQKVTIEWKPFTTNAGTITSYNLYMSTSPDNFDINAPVRTGLSANARTVDFILYNGNPHYFRIRAVAAGTILETTYPADEIKIVLPPENMVLVHRWMVNQEMCELMGRTSDPANNFRCPYTGPMNVDGYYDIEKSFFVDRYEMGCNYTKGPTGCGLADGCLTRNVAGAPVIDDSVGNVDDVKFDVRDWNTSVCSIKTASNWMSLGLNTVQRRKLASNAAGLPPLKVDHQNAWDTCQAMSVPGLGNKKLPSRRHQIAFSAWHPSFSSTYVNDRQRGVGGYGAKSCVTDAHGLSFSATWPIADMRTLASIEGPNGQIVTGSEESSLCTSRYGVQDAIGNVPEFLSEYCPVVFNGLPGVVYCQSGMATLDSSINDFANINFDGNTLMGNMSTGVGTNYYMTTNYGDGNHSIDRILLPLGLPVVSSATHLDGTVIGYGPEQISPVRLDSNFVIGVGGYAAPGAKYLVYGYNHRSVGGNNGISGSRFGGSFYRYGADNSIGFRCMIDAE